jgi:hypothetical protein
MTPKEKAKELVSKFEDIDNMGRYSGEFGESVWSTIELRRQAKQCALLTVAEILLTLNKDIKDLDVVGNVLLNLIDYWKEVEQEIEKL